MRAGAMLGNVQGPARTYLRKLNMFSCIFAHLCFNLLSCTGHSLSPISAQFPSSLTELSFIHLLTQPITLPGLLTY